VAVVGGLAVDRLEQVELADDVRGLKEKTFCAAAEISASERPSLAVPKVSTWMLVGYG
jgi:hypothetical protein